MDGEKVRQALSEDLIETELSQRLPEDLVEEEVSKNRYLQCQAAGMDDSREPRLKRPARPFRNFPSDAIPKDSEKEDLCESLPQNSVEMEVSKNLPDDVVEKIIAMVPFPWICTARGLSKSWLSKFSAISSQDDEGNKRSAISFQKQVDEWSKNWETFYPIFCTDGKDRCVAYQLGSSLVWQEMPSLSFLPNYVMDHVRRGCSLVQIEGALVYIVYGTLEFGEYEIFVANSLTRSWKHLPPHPRMDSKFRGKFVFCGKFVKLPSLETFKVILLTTGTLLSLDTRSDMTMPCSAHIYDAKSDTWTSVECLVPCKFTLRPCSSAYLDGVLYMVAADAESLLAFNLEELTVEECPLALNLGELAIREFGLAIEDPELDSRFERRFCLVVCNANLVMIRDYIPPKPEIWARVLKIDLGSSPFLRASQVAEGPPPALDATTIEPFEPVSDGKSIFLGITHCGKRVLGYNMDTDEWSCLPIHVPFKSRKIYLRWNDSMFEYHARQPR